MNKWDDSMDDTIDIIRAMTPKSLRNQEIHSELLFIHLQLGGRIMLKDSKGFCLGTFSTEAECNKWAHDNGYRTRKIS